MPLNWIKANEHSFNDFLLLERFQIDRMIHSEGWYNDKSAWRHSIGKR
jgi:hypothetical protein